MNFDGFTPAPIPLFSGMVEQDSPTKLPLGVSPIARGIEFHMTSARTRSGVRADFGFNTGNPVPVPVTGLAAATLSEGNQKQFVFDFDADGFLQFEDPVGSQTVSPITSPLLTLPSDASMQSDNAFQRTFFAFSDLKRPSSFGAVYNLKTGNLDPLSMNPVGVTWTKSTAYVIGDVVTPTAPVGGNGHTYRCTQAGFSDAVEPVWPLTLGGTVVDSSCVWTENTMTMQQTLAPPDIPVIARVAGAGTFPAGRDVYISVTFVNGVGSQTAASPPAALINTNLNDAVQVTSPVLPAWVASFLTGPFHITQYKVYEADVPTGNPAPVLTDYHVSSTQSIGVPQNVTTTGVGAPAGPSNFLGAPGHVSPGVRYAVVLYVDRNEYITGMSQASVISGDFPLTSLTFALLFRNIPIGPSPQTAARILAITPAGQLSQIAGTGVTTAGPYFWIPPRFPIGTFDLGAVPPGITIADVVNGVNMNSTLINDNTTTTAIIDFTDDYLKSTQNEVSSYFRKIKVPPIADVRYLPSVRRMAYATDNIPQGWYISAEADPETVFGSKGLFQLEDTWGTRTAILELQGVIYPMKQRAGYALVPTPEDPSTWRADPKWTGIGPCGFRAAASCKSFLTFVHRSGGYVYFGAELPRLITTELTRTWATINWAAEHTIWAMIDEETRTVRYGIPTGDSIVPDKILTCNYEESPEFEPPMHVTMQGEFKATIRCRKWSVDPIAANVCIRAERPFGTPPPEMDQATKRSQILLASSNSDGVISAIIPGTRSDFGAHGLVGIDSVIETACPEEMLNVVRLGGVEADIEGEGDILFTVLAGRGTAAAEGAVDPAIRYLEIPLRKNFNPNDKPGRPGYSCGARGQNEKFRLRVSNNKAIDAWFDIHSAVLYGNEVSSAENK